MAAKKKDDDMPWYAWIIMLVVGLLVLGGGVWGVMAITEASGSEETPSSGSGSGGGFFEWLFKGSDESSLKDKVKDQFDSWRNWF